MLDQIHGDEPLQTSGTGPVDVDNDSSESGEDPRETMHTGTKNNTLLDNMRCNRSHRLREDIDKSDPVQNGEYFNQEFTCTIWA